MTSREPRARRQARNNSQSARSRSRAVTATGVLESDRATRAVNPRAPSATSTSAAAAPGVNGSKSVLASASDQGPKNSAG